MPDFDLKHCPYPPCRSERLGVQCEMGTGQWKVHCDGCNMEGPSGETPMEAMEYWNKLPRMHLQLVPDETKPY